MESCNHLWLCYVQDSSTSILSLFWTQLFFRTFFRIGSALQRLWRIPRHDHSLFRMMGQLAKLAFRFFPTCNGSGITEQIIPGWSLAASRSEIIISKDRLFPVSKSALITSTTQCTHFIPLSKHLVHAHRGGKCEACFCLTHTSHTSFESKHS